MDKKILLIIPAYNEEKNIVKTINSIQNYKKINLDYIVINDGSSDNTKGVMEKNNINFIDLPFNLGIGAAVQTGYKYAFYNDYDIAIQFDGDGQHDINSVDKIIDPIVSEDADMVVGSRYVDDSSNFKSSLSRRFGIKIISSLIYLMSRKTIKDVTSGYRAINKKVIKVFAKEYPFAYPEPITNYALLKTGFNVKEIGVNMFERTEGKSSISMFKSVYYMFNVCLSILLFNFKKFKDVIK